MAKPPASGSSTRTRGILGTIEWLGNQLPDPAMLFVIGAVVVMLLSAVLAPRQTDQGPAGGWVVQPRISQQAYELLERDGQPVMHRGAPRVRLLTNDAGEPVLEQVPEQRRFERIMQPAEPGQQPRPLLDDSGAPIVVLRETTPQTEIVARSLLTSEGLYWAARSLVDNFMGFAPLGVVLTGMLGIGVAEKTGMLGAGLRAFVLLVPRFLLTPALVFLGIMSSMGIDAGYIVLPPLAAALYKSLGRSPLVGIAAVFAGVSAGFNANLFVTGLDPMLAELSTTGAQVIDPDYAVAATCNWWFAIASTFLMTLSGWAVTALVVEPYFNRKSADDGGPQEVTAEDRAAVRGHSFASGFGVFMLLLLFLAVALGPIAAPQSPAFLLGPACGWLAGLAPDWFGGLAPWSATQAAWPLWQCLCIPAAASILLLPVFVYALSRGGMPPAEAAGLAWATVTQSVIVWGVAIMAVLPGAPLYGIDPDPPNFMRWVQVIVPIIFLSFLLPGIAYGIAVGTVSSVRDVARLMNEAIAGMAPIVVLAFFAAQFIEYFKYTQLDRMLAWSGGMFLAEAEMDLRLLIVAFILLTMVFNLFVGSMSAKYTMFAPIFIPMFMMVGISPELTQAAYRIGDSVSNVITPLNSYIVILLVFMQKYVPRAAMGTVISMMMPYTIAFVIVWTIMLLVWIQAGWPLGIGGPLTYTLGG